MPNKLKKDNIRLGIEKEWPSAKAFGTILPNYMITPDSTFTRLKTGAGDIEYFNEPYINYGSEDNPNIILNPNGNIPTLLYSPLNNSLDDVKLDLLHHYREYDPAYLDLLQDYTSTLDKGEILWNSLLGDLFRNKYPNTYNKHWKEWDTLVNNTTDNSLYMVLGIDGSLRNLLAKEETIKKSNYAPREEAILQYLNTPKAQQAFNAIQLYLESNRLPEVTVTPNSHADGGSLKSPLDWNELSMKERAAYIRMGVSRGYKDIDSIKLVYNEFRSGGNLYGNGGGKKVPVKKQEYIYDVLPRLLREAGLNIKVSSGYREPGEVGTAGKKSWHWRHGAVDIVPQGKTTFKDIENAIYSNPTIYNYMLTNGFGLLDESGRTAASRAFMKKTGATGSHFHFGRDSKAVASYRNKMQLVLKGQPLPEVRKNAIIINLQPNELIRANTEGKTVYFKNPPGWNDNIEQPIDNQMITISTPAIPLLDNNTTLDTNSTTTPEKVPVNENIGLNMLNPVEVVAERPKPMMSVADTIDFMNSMYLPYKPVEYPQPKTATERLAELNLELNTLLALDLEDTILRNSALGIYDNDLLKRKVGDLQFYRNMAANGGNLFGFGGDEDEIEKTLPTQVVTPRGNYIQYTGNESSVPTIKDYFDIKANESRINAANHIIHLRIPNIPTVPSREFISVVSGIMGMSDEERIKRFGTANVETCIYTATSLFNDKGAKVSGNVTFNNNPLLFGFTPVSIRDIQEGDLILFIADGRPTHSALVTGFNMNGEPVLSYSRGGTEEYGHYWDDKLNKEVFKPTMAYDNEMNNVLSSFEGFDTYRYTGSDSQKLNWAKEYSNKFNVPYSDVYPEVLNSPYNKPNLVKSGSWAFGGPIVQKANHIYDGTSEPTLLMNDDEEDKIYNAQPVTLMMNVVASKPTVHWDGFNWIGYNDLGQRITKGPSFNPANANIIDDPVEFENARLKLARKKDINHTHTFAEDIRNLATGLVMAPAVTTFASLTPMVGEAAANSSIGNSAIQLMSRPVSTIAKGVPEYIPQVSKVLPYMESIDRGIWGTSGLLGMKDAYEGWLSGEKHWGNALAEGALSGLMLGEMSSTAKEAGKTLYNTAVKAWEDYKYPFGKPVIPKDYIDITPKNIEKFYHGSPYNWNVYNSEYIGSGEGASKGMKGLNLSMSDGMSLSPKMANMRSKDAPLHLGRPSVEPLTEVDPRVYTFEGENLNLFNTPNVRGLNLEELISLGFDGIRSNSPRLVTIFPQSVGKLRMVDKSTIPQFIKAHPEVETWVPFTRSMLKTGINPFKPSTITWEEAIKKPSYQQLFSSPERTGVSSKVITDPNDANFVLKQSRQGYTLEELNDVLAKNELLNKYPFIQPTEYVESTVGADGKYYPIWRQGKVTPYGREAIFGEDGVMLPKDLIEASRAKSNEAVQGILKAAQEQGLQIQDGKILTPDGLIQDFGEFLNVGFTTNGMPVIFDGLLNTNLKLIKPYEIETYPGYQLKSLMRGNPLEKQLSKTGTISVNSIKAQATKGSNVEKAVIEDVLASEQFAGQKSIDYNAFRKAVQEKLITYTVVPNDKYADYGVRNLGFSRFGQGPDIENARQIARDLPREFPDRFEVHTNPFFNIIDKQTGRTLENAEDFLEYADLLKEIYEKHNVANWPKLNTFTFESPRILRGNDAHYNPTTLGHSRTYTTADEPEILHVMESQSDWGLLTKDLSPKFVFKRAENGNTNVSFDENGNFYFTEEGEGMPYKDFVNLDLPREQMPHTIAKTLYIENYPTSLIKYLHDNYLQRQLQENLKYAAKHGLTKMRYPTSETAAKIEGYPKTFNTRNLTESLMKVLDELDKERYGYWKDYYNASRGVDAGYMTNLNRGMSPSEWNSLIERLGVTQQYSPEHQTILKKYSDFPKMYGKLYKGAEVRTVTDAKGNTWYEVDVPKDYLNLEWQYSLGGNLNKISGPLVIAANRLYST